MALHRPLRKFKRSHAIPPLPDLGREHRAQPVPTEPDRLVADVDAAFKQQILDLAQR
jgi:hypothetical protein